MIKHLMTIYKKRKQYFEGIGKIVAKDNLNSAFLVSIGIVILLTFFILLAPLIIKGWVITPYHITFFVSSLVLCAIMTKIRKRNMSYRGTNTFCILMIIYIFSFIYLIDTFGAVNRPTCFVPASYIALFSIFTLPYWLSYGLLLLFELVYIITVLEIKPIFIGQYDIYISLVGIFCAFFTTTFTMSLKMKAYKNQIKYHDLSSKDELTDVYNRRGGINLAKEYIRQHNPYTLCTFIIIDLDDFKEVNDTKGHQNGDKVLNYMGKILRKEFRETDIVVRFGGDEFIVLVKGIASKSVALKKCSSIQHNFSKWALHHMKMDIGCSYGIALVDRKNVKYDKLFHQVDQALYEAKANQGKRKSVIVEYQEDSAYDERINGTLL